jgi:pimeloyl-ACP methyl ester carboxylesterase
MGLSERTRVGTLEERMDDVRAVMGATGSERAALIGVSEGGPMSMLFAASYPERTQALLLIGAEVREETTADWPWGEATREEFESYMGLLGERWGRDLVAGSGLEFEDRGSAELKGVPGEWRLYAVSAA